MNDTIAALCTAPGAAGLAVLRVSGPGAVRVADGVFRGPAPLAGVASHTLHHGWAWANAERLDEVVAAVFLAPRSYTGEDVVELSCHGGPVSATRVCEALLRSGARLAGPGEFTLRAFLHGRIDLAQAEAVADVIHADSRAAHDLALTQLAGALSRRLAAVSDRLADGLAEVEARVDFAEDVGGVEVPPYVTAMIADVAAELDALLDGAEWGRALRDGFRLPLVGRPNVGKSSLFNLLVGEDRAIVTPVPGTTRDRVSESVEIAGVRVALSDTAGLRDARDPVETIGVDRTRDMLEHSPAVIWVVDGAVPLAAEDHAIAALLDGKQVLVALNKRDLGTAVTPEDARGRLHGERPPVVVEVSATRGDGATALRAAVATLIDARGGAARNRAPATSNPRHVEALDRARASLGLAAAAAAAGEPGECVAFELRESLAAIGEVTGRNVDAEVLDRIFARFCIGK